MSCSTFYSAASTPTPLSPPPPSRGAGRASLASSPCSSSMSPTCSQIATVGTSAAASTRRTVQETPGAEARRRVHRVSLVISPTHDSGILKALNRLIATAVGGWGVEDLEVVALNRYRREVHARRGSGYSFPHRCLDQKFPNSIVKLKRLKLINCDPRAVRLAASPVRAFSALTMLVLQDMPMSTHSRVYEGVISACPVLEVLHLMSCGCRGPSLVVDAPGSRITELVVELSGPVMFLTVDLRSLPRLERLACIGAPLELRFGSVPRLARLNVTYSLFDCPIVLDFSRFIGGLRGVEDLVLSFTGPRMSVQPGSVMPLLGKLRRLLVADVPPAWDITCTRCLLEAAPCLETLHVADDEGDMARLPSGEPPASEFRHRCLREVVVSGFEGTPAQVGFVTFLRRLCTVLRDIVLVRHGHVRQKGFWDWETVAPPEERQWSEEKKGAVLTAIEDGADAIACSNTRIVFG